MTIGNVIDNRKNEWDVDCDAVFEPSWHDNSPNSTKFKRTDDLDPFDIDYLYDTTVCKAIEYVSGMNTPMTIYLYDKGSKPCG